MYKSKVSKLSESPESKHSWITGAKVKKSNINHTSVPLMPSITSFPKVNHYLDVELDINGIIYYLFFICLTSHL